MSADLILIAAAYGCLLLVLHRFARFTDADDGPLE